MSYIPPNRTIEVSDGAVGCALCGACIESGRKFVLFDADEICICIPCCDCLASDAHDSRYEEET